MLTAIIRVCLSNIHGNYNDNNNNNDNGNRRNKGKLGASEVFTSRLAFIHGLKSTNWISLASNACSTPHWYQRDLSKLAV